MTIQAIFELILEYRLIVLATMFLAPWVSYLLCILIPGTKEEPFILNLNLLLALLCLGGEITYLAYASHTGGIEKIVTDSEFLFLLAPVYYVGVSMWVSRQRLSLSQLPAFRAVQGFGMIVAAYLMLSWLFGKLRIVLFSSLPLGFLVLAVLLLISLGYLGYLKVAGKRSDQSSGPSRSSRYDRDAAIEKELEQIRKNEQL